MKAVKAAGGLTAVQDPANSEMPFMPQRALDEVQVDFVVNDSNVRGFLEACCPHAV
jgi:two-component system chemotaxis response regulator CheB